MIPFAVFLLFGLAGTVLMTETPLDPPEEGEEEEENGQIVVTTGGEFVGTEGVDRFTLDADRADPEADFVDVTIIAGAGDDVLALLDGEPGIAPDPSQAPGRFQDATIDGGGGNDRIEIVAERSVIYGGEGDDTILVYDASSTRVEGGAGNDTIGGTLFASDPAVFNGGSGDDMIDGRQIDNGTLSGGEGNDTILVSGFNQGGAGYVVETDGGAGDDIIVFDGGPVVSENNQNLVLLGGTEADSFRLAFDEGGAVDSSLIEVGASDVALDLVRIGDFTPGEDTLTLAPRVADTVYTVTGVRMVEDTPAGTTDVIVRYESETALNRDIVITLDAINVAGEDIVLDGALAGLDLVIIV